MLVAKSNDQFVNAFNANKREEYYCPECGEQLILKKGKCKVAHFAHGVNSKCQLQKGESYEHLLGKQQIFEWARQNNWYPELEVYISSLKQRADVLLNVQGRQVAIEFQCSPLSLIDLQERTRGYEKLGIKCYWFLGSPYELKIHQRQTQKFIQLLNNRYRLIFWNIKSAAIKIENATIWEQRLNLRQINKNYRTLHQLISLPETKMNFLRNGLPLICHQRLRGIQVTKHPEIYWRYLVCRKLADIPLFTSFSQTSWIKMLRKVEASEWVIFPCLPPMILINTYLRLFTGQLIRCGIIVRRKKRIILVKYPRSSRSLAEQEQEVQKLLSGYQ
ncbi:competence protein CoiA [Limosilactobacillus fastidiosus]|uniref:Competence protein CoiA n=1 Tax=Limosilactobacillus fastidiosus TaxID=2759855 RepID=A0ABR6E5B6_9LACO|nr:competence protein CoiA family protein [Limosilactobacillus fastidiosus]MBB1062378.1 hypothetical protein [Limosilactobacillus fastidiosus]MCD7083453.1 hypothetical protein [Limosilactobacillus fastidiosus]